MNAVPAVEIVEIDAALLPAASRFLERRIGRGIKAADFSAALGRRWAAGPIGVALVASGAIVGAIGTIRSRRVVGGRAREFCNLTSLAIDPEFRSLAPALVRRATDNPDAVYTNFTASDSVTELLRAFRFVELEPVERVLLPWASDGRGSASVVVGGDAVERWLRGRQPEIAELVADHRSTRADWMVIDADGEWIAIALQLMRARGVPLGHVMYASHRTRFAGLAPTVARACRRQFGFRLLAWPAWQYPATGSSVAVRRPRPVLIRGDAIAPSDIDALYSELTLLPILV